MDAKHRRWLDSLNAKGAEVAGVLADVLVGVRPDLTGLALDDEHGTSARERLAIWLRRINAARERIFRGEFGRCCACDEPIPDAELDLAPWAERCAGCTEALSHHQEDPARVA